MIKLKKKTIFILSTLVLALILALYLTFRASNKNQNTKDPATVFPIPTFSDSQKDNNIQGLKPDSIKPDLTVTSVQQQLGQSIKNEGDLYYFKSNSPVDSHQALFENNKLVLFKEIITYNQERDVESIISKYELSEDAILLYGDDYENNILLFVYLDKGIAYLATANQDYLVEVWYFKPTDIETFKLNFAKEYYNTPEEWQENSEESF